MKIVATCRTFNERDHIEKFCEAYSQFSDLVLIADGGSMDGTVALASKFPKVKVRDYPIKVQLKNGFLRNPDGPHVQFLVDWATEEGGDWIVHQDCDQRPNKFLKEDVRDILSATNKDFLQVTQIYVWGKDKYFPVLSGKDDGWWQGLWAWRLSTGLKILDKMPHYEFSLDGVNSTDINKTGRQQNILPPYCFMHFGWETPEKTQAHIDYYKRSGLIEGMTSPLFFGGRLEPLEEWMIE